MLHNRFWDGTTVHVVANQTVHDRRHVEIGLTPQTASNLALALQRLKQTTIPLDPSMQELLLALDYVLVGDPASTAANKRIEAGKGMTPDGGYRAPNVNAQLRSPEGIQHPFVLNTSNPDFCHAPSRYLPNGVCWQPRAAHYGEPSAPGEREVNP